MSGVGVGQGASNAVLMPPLLSLGNSNDGSSDVKSHPWFQGVDWFGILNQEVTAPYQPTISGAEDLSNFENFEFKDRYKSRINRHPELFANF